MAVLGATFYRFFQDRFFRPVPRLLSLTADGGWTNSPYTELRLTGYGANANGGGVEHVVLVAARILSEAAAVQAEAKP